ncbi:MAG: hypothetical protein IIB17_05150 [Chloroflexi bacterium]|nr:hypothetical protein [Chloroflexota bacterium]
MVIDEYPNRALGSDDGFADYEHGFDRCKILIQRARNLSIPTILSLAESTSFHAIIEALFQGDEAES